MATVEVLETNQTVEISETSQTVNVQSGVPDATSLQGNQLPSSPSDGEVLRYNGKQWEHVGEDATNPGSAKSQTLNWDGSIWVPRIDEYNVKDFGALGDNTQDDATPINDAADAARVDFNANKKPILVFPPGTYKCSASVWLGKDSNNEYVQHVHGDGARIRSTATGEPAVDWTGIQSKTMRGLEIEGDSSNMPSVGLLLARDDSGASAGTNYLEDLIITGHFSTACLYNYASEVTTYMRCEFQQLADVNDVVFVGSTNYRNVTSPNTTLYSGDISNNSHNFISCTFSNRVDTVGASDPSVLRIVGGKQFRTQRCFFDFNDSGVGSDIILEQDTANGGRQTGGFESFNDLFHGSERVGIECRDTVRRLFVLNPEAPSVSDALVKGEAGCSVFHAWIWAEDEPVDFGANNADMKKAFVHTEGDITFNRNFQGIIETVSSATVDLQGLDRATSGEIRYLDTGQTVRLLDTNDTAFTDGDSTPDVSGGDTWETNNSSATTITDFDNPTYGQRIMVLVKDGNTTFQHGSGLLLSGASDWTAAADGDMVEFVYDGSDWRETNRSDNT